MKRRRRRRIGRAVNNKLTATGKPMGPGRSVTAQSRVSAPANRRSARGTVAAKGPRVSAGVGRDPLKRTDGRNVNL
jgi:hypothetical protein